MKYIKNFEAKKQDIFKFKIGDYVKYDINNKTISSYKIKNNKIYKILHRYTNHYVKDPIINNYQLESVYNDSNPFWEYESQLVKLTPEEVEKLKMEININKYNI